MITFKKRSWKLKTVFISDTVVVADMSDAENQNVHNELELEDVAANHGSEPGRDPEGRASLNEPDTEEKANIDVPCSEQPNNNLLDEAESNQEEPGAGIAGELNEGAAKEQADEEEENENDAEGEQEKETESQDEGEQTEAGIVVAEAGISTAEAGISVTVRKDNYDSLDKADQSPRDDAAELELDITTVTSVQPYTSDAAATGWFMFQLSKIDT